MSSKWVVSDCIGVYVCIYVCIYGCVYDCMYVCMYVCSNWFTFVDIRLSSVLMYSGVAWLVCLIYMKMFSYVIVMMDQVSSMVLICICMYWVSKFGLYIC